MRAVTQIIVLLLLVTVSDCATVPGDCERDVQCGAGTCCAISLLARGLRVCTPLGRRGDECHPASRKIPSSRKRRHHTCPCRPHLKCSKGSDGKYRCTKMKKVKSSKLDFRSPMLPGFLANTA
ncbi:prokineticin-1-like [Saccopteryx leptura]|uniref:prokineticin-1-like n=1 Tax=Saccopteryx leptura TaxID=249018 RepID=UPI00339BA82D